MKTLTLLFVIFAAITAQGRQLAFSNVSLTTVHDRKIITYTIPRETNIRFYRIEASNDGILFEVIATLPSKGNALFPTNYQYDLTPYNYKYYRMGMVEMNGTMPHSQVVTSKMELEAQPVIKAPTREMTSKVLANQ